MRISGGDARGIRLKVPKRARPASEKVRQAMFSSLAAHVPDARVLDLYAGSGAYALEAVSRGATSAICVDNDAEAVSVCRANAKSAGLEDRVQVRQSAVDRYVQRAASTDGPFDLVFIDPPYGGAVERVLEGLAGSIDRAGRVVLERRWRDEPPPTVPGMVVEADRRYGDTRVLVFTLGADG